MGYTHQKIGRYGRYIPRSRDYWLELSKTKSSNNLSELIESLPPDADAIRDAIDYTDSVSQKTNDLLKKIKHTTGKIVAPMAVATGAYKLYVASNTMKLKEIENMLRKHGVTEAYVHPFARSAYKGLRSKAVRGASVSIAAGGLASVIFFLLLDEDEEDDEKIDAKKEEVKPTSKDDTDGVISFVVFSAFLAWIVYEILQRKHVIK